MVNQTKSSPFKKDIDTSLYQLKRDVSREEIINMALKLVKRKFVRGSKLASPHDTRHFLTLNLAEREREVFMVIFVVSTQSSIRRR